MKTYTLKEIAEKNKVSVEAVRHKIHKINEWGRYSTFGWVDIGRFEGKKLILTKDEVGMLSFRLGSLKVRKNAKK